MLSILIPTYNYNAFPLVAELYNQCIEAKTIFEIIVLDDGSSNFLEENNKINELENCRLELLKNNIGRSAIRNSLANKAVYDNLLFLDVDTIPIYNNFISTYINQISDNVSIIYGGIQYQNEKPNDKYILRWIYGNSREALSVEKRQENPYLSFLTLNFFIKKEVFNMVSFNEKIPNLRHEDTLFSYNLKIKNIHIKHIENPIFHLGIDSSVTFLKKSEEAVEGLHFLITNNLMPYQYTKLSSLYWNLKKYKINGIAFFILRNSVPFLKKNILGNQPSLFLFDLYRLYYYCKING